MSDPYRQISGSGAVTWGDDFASLLLRVGETLRDRLQDLTNRCGLTESRFQVLAELAEFGEQGCSQTELAQRLGQSDSSICGLVDRMQVDGLLFRFRSKVDRRRSLLMLSQEGRERWNRAARERSTQFELLIGSYPEGSRLRLAGQLNEFMAHLLAFPPFSTPVRSDSGGSLSGARLERIREAG